MFLSNGIHGRVGYLILVSCVSLFLFSSCEKSGMASIAPNVPIKNGENSNVHFDDDGEYNPGDGSDTDPGGNENPENNDNGEIYAGIMTGLSGNTIRTYFDEDFEDKHDAGDFDGVWYYDKGSLINEFNPISTSGFESLELSGEDLFGIPAKEGMLSWEVEFPDFPDGKNYSAEFYIVGNIKGEEQYVEFTTANGTPSFWPEDDQGNPIDMSDKMMLFNTGGFTIGGTPDELGFVQFTFMERRVPHLYSLAITTKNGKYHFQVFLDKIFIAESNCDYGPGDFSAGDGFGVEILIRKRTYVNPSIDVSDVVTMKWNWAEFTPAR